MLLVAGWVSRKEAYEIAIRDKVTVEIYAVRFNHIGIPRSGKSAFRDRLTGKVENLDKEEEMADKKGERPSTGVAESGIQILRKVESNFGVVSKGWSLLTDPEDEAELLSQLISQLKKVVASKVATSSATPTSSSSKAATSDAVDASNSEQKDASKEYEKLPVKSKDIDEIFSQITKGVQNKDWEEVKYLLEDLILIINTDTGGQAEFFDLQAPLISGPSLNLLFWRLNDNLEDVYKAYCTNSERVSTGKKESTLKVEEVLYQAMANIGCFSDCFSSASSSEEAVKSLMMFVGTFRDKIKPEEFVKKDELLREKVERTAFYEKGMVERASTDKFMFEVDNRYGRDKIVDIRQRLEEVIRKKFRKIKIPIAWLILSLYMRMKKLRVVSLEECEGLAEKVGIGSSELQDALNFLHDHGLLLYYPKIRL